VTDNSPKVWQINAAGIRPWITFFLICALMGSLGLGWLLKSALLILGFIILLPVVAIGGFILWSRLNIVQAKCPVCEQELTGFKGTELDCPSCGEALKVVQGSLTRVAPPNTIDIAAIEIDTP
jgi:ribosomal protein S27E